MINSLHQARLWLDAGGGTCDLMVDTGINRLGLPPAQIGDPLIARLEIDTLMSHLASADEDSPQNERQLSASASRSSRRRSERGGGSIML